MIDLRRVATCEFSSVNSWLLLSVLSYRLVARRRKALIFSVNICSK